MTVLSGGKPYEIRFDEATHTYWRDDADGQSTEIPGVSRILEATGNHGSFKPAAHYFEKGRTIHGLCQGIDEGTLTLDSIQKEFPALSTYVEAWLAFKRDNHVRVLGIEEIVFEPTLFYAGTLDRTIVMRGRDRPIVVDIKSGAKADWHNLQLAAYVLARGGEKWTEYDGANVYLKANGRYGWDPLGGGALDWSIDRWRQIVQQYKETA